MLAYACRLERARLAPVMLSKADLPGLPQRAVWDEEFRMTVYEVEGEQQYLHVRTMRQVSATEDEVIGEAKILLDGSWTEFDGTVAALRTRQYSLRGCIAYSSHSAEWVAIKEDGKYRGEVYLELTWYPRESPEVSLRGLLPAAISAMKIDPCFLVPRRYWLTPAHLTSRSGDSPFSSTRRSERD